MIFVLLLTLNRSYLVQAIVHATCSTPLASRMTLLANFLILTPRVPLFLYVEGGFYSAVYLGSIDFLHITCLTAGYWISG